MKKFVTLFLAALMLQTAVMTSACSNGGDGENPITTASSIDTTPEETEEERILPDLPDITFDGSDFRFYSWDYNEWRVWDDIWAESQNGEPINDAVYKRNSLIEQNYDIHITFQYDVYTDYNMNVKKMVQASEEWYEVLISMGHCIPSLYTSNVFYNLHDIEYLDFEKPWWDQNAVESFTLAGYMPFAVSDMTILDKSVAGAVFFNKKLAEDYNVGNLYDRVLNNQWTIADMIEIGKNVSDDLNGDGKYDDDDRYGLVCGDDPVYLLFHGSGCRYITTDADGYPKLSFESEYNYTVIQYYLENLMYDEQLTRNNAFVSNSKPVVKMFMENQSLFYMDKIVAFNTLRDMEADFGILPIPKYETSQSNYQSSVSVFGGNLISVPITSTHLEMIGVIIEAMSAESKYTLIPAFYDTVLKAKSMRDNESEAMLDIIFDNLVFDLGDYYNLANFSDNFLRITGSVYNSGNTGYPKRTSDVASFYASWEKKLNKALDDLIKIIDKWNEM